MSNHLRGLALALTACSALLSSCKKDPAPTSQPAAKSEPAPAHVPPPLLARPPESKTRWTEPLLHTEIKRHNPAYEGAGQFNLDDGQVVAVVVKEAKVTNLAFLEKLRDVQALDLSSNAITDLSPLKGLKLMELYLEDTQVQDLAALRGMPLQKLYLSHSPVRDISALAGMQLDEFNAVETKIADLTPLAQSTIRMFWLTGSPVESITALRTVRMESLTLHRTKVKDLSPLSGTALKRLHIGDTPVEDLTPLKNMPALTRLVFTPANIKAGLDAAKALPLQEIGTRFDDQAKDLAPPDIFWRNLEAAK